MGMSLFCGWVGLHASVAAADATADNATALLRPPWTSSARLYGQPHAVWLDRYDQAGANRKLLKRALKAAEKAHCVPELVIYAIPMRDLAQASEGGFVHMADYLEDNRINAALLAEFQARTGLKPVVYLEPDALPQAVQLRKDRQDDAESRRFYTERVETLRSLIALYRRAGAGVYLEAGHSGWFDYADEDVRRIAEALNDAGIAQADGLASNISNRQPIPSEIHYLRRLLPLLAHPHPDVRVDTSRNGGPTRPRRYTLAPDGSLWDDETLSHPVAVTPDEKAFQGRRVGRWERLPGNDLRLLPFYGKPKTLSRLMHQERYTYNAETRILTAPPWLDPVGDVQPGPPPSDHPPAAPVIARYRYIKPPDECDGALNYPPGRSKREINARTSQKQPRL